MKDMTWQFKGGAERPVITIEHVQNFSLVFRNANQINIETAFQLLKLALFFEQLIISRGEGMGKLVLSYISLVDLQIGAAFLEITLNCRLKIEIPFNPIISLFSFYSDLRYVQRQRYKNVHFHISMIAENWKLPKWLKQKKFKVNYGISLRLVIM